MRDDFRPDWSSSPGETISDMLTERGMSVESFAAQMDSSTKSAQDLLDGKATITVVVAQKLSKVVGGSFQFWMARDGQYRDDASRLDQKYSDWLREIPIGDMIRFGWIEPVRPSEEVASCLRYFNVPNVAAWHEKYAGIEKMAAFRMSRSFESRPASVAAWLRQGEVEAEKIQCKPWNPAAFGSALLAIRRLTKQKDPKRFLPALERMCAESGVAFVLVRWPSGCRASGATRMLSSDKVLLQLSARYLSDDQFWFTFFHEAAHVLLHASRDFVIDGIDDQATAHESAANNFAERTLIPDAYKATFEALRSAEQVLSFAHTVGIAPGIVVGQLQYSGRIPRSWLNGLKRRYTWDV
jgi:HTH-type transcriptional regulator/antitoxin HigA